MPEIVAGFCEDIRRDSGEWLIVDIGFSSNEATCGIWDEAQQPRVVKFGDLVKLTKGKAKEKSQEPLNLLIEAPLSVAFQCNRNPSRRKCDTKGNIHRDWYVNAGATTLLAASYLLQELVECEGRRRVRLFEGLVSFKRSGSAPKTKAGRIEANKADVLKLKNCVWHEANDQIFAPSDLRQNPTDIIQ